MRSRLGLMLVGSCVAIGGVLGSGCDGRKPEAIHGEWEEEAASGRPPARLRFGSDELLYFDETGNRGFRKYALRYDVSREPWQLEASGAGYLAGTLAVTWTDDDHIVLTLGQATWRLRRAGAFDWDRAARRDRCPQVLAALGLHVVMAQAGGTSRFPELGRAALDGKTPEGHRCPKDPGDGATSYRTWSRGTLPQGEPPASVPVLWDATPDFHGTERCVLFADGSTRFLAEKEFQQILDGWRAKGFAE